LERRGAVPPHCRARWAHLNLDELIAQATAIPVLVHSDALYTLILWHGVWMMAMVLA